MINHLLFMLRVYWHRERGGGMWKLPYDPDTLGISPAPFVEDSESVRQEQGPPSPSLRHL